MACLETLPGDFDQLETLLYDESWCRKYFISARWPEGFTCNHCNRDNIVLSDPDSTTCPHCGHTFSLTAGTLLHGTKKSVSHWLRAVWFMCTSFDRLSIKSLQNNLEINNYQTARSWIDKLYCARKVATDKKCMATVEVEDCTLFIRKERTVCHLFAALEVNLKNCMTGRLRMFHCKKLSADTLHHVLNNCVHKGSTLLLPDREPYSSYQSHHYLSITESSSVCQGASRSLRSFIASHLNHSSTVFSRKRLEALRDDFCFQENKRLFPDIQAVFDDLISSIVNTPPLSSTVSSTVQEIYDGDI